MDINLPNANIREHYRERQMAFDITFENTADSSQFKRPPGVYKQFQQNISVHIQDLHLGDCPARPAGRTRADVLLQSL